MTDDQKLAFDVARDEIEHRRKKQWDIFSWAVTIFISTIAGVLVLTSKRELVLDVWFRAMMAVALGALTTYAGFWLHFNIQAEGDAVTEVKKLLPAAPIGKPSNFRLGYVAITVIIGAAAVVTIVCSNLIPVAVTAKN